MCIKILVLSFQRFIKKDSFYTVDFIGPITKTFNSVALHTISKHHDDTLLAKGASNENNNCGHEALG